MLEGLLSVNTKADGEGEGPGALGLLMSIYGVCVCIILGHLMIVRGGTVNNFVLLSTPTPSP